MTIEGGDDTGARTPGDAEVHIFKQSPFPRGVVFLTGPTGKILIHPVLKQHIDLFRTVVANLERVQRECKERSAHCTLRLKTIRDRPHVEAEIAVRKEQYDLLISDIRKALMPYQNLIEAARHYHLTEPLRLPETDEMLALRDAAQVLLKAQRQLRESYRDVYPVIH